MINEILSDIQTRIKAHKGQKNAFGKYNYRSCEDILEAVKPLLSEFKATLTLSDNIVEVGGKLFVEATAVLAKSNPDKKDISVPDTIAVTAFAMHPLDSPGMSVAQMTGAASSYARKYALNGLLAIDDTKDCDATNKHDKTSKPASKVPSAEEMKKTINAALTVRFNKIKSKALKKGIELEAFENILAQVKKTTTGQDKILDVLEENIEEGVLND